MRAMSGEGVTAMLVLTLISAFAVLLLFVVLAYALTKISGLLRDIGGTPTSYLAKLRLGLRAISSETGHLEPQVIKLNEGLSQVAEGLRVVDGHLVGTLSAAQRQEG